MKSYLVNEIFYTIQGEGYWTGRPAVFVRFARCNLWSGREEDRASAVCRFCDTDFVYAERLELPDIVDNVFSQWPMESPNAMVVFTGGEPLLQLDERLIWALKDLGFYVAVETNGTMTVPDGVDWLCVSPKIATRTKASWAHELKLVYPQDGLLTPDKWVDYPADYHWLSPMDGPDYETNLQDAIEYVKRDPRWRLNIQTHKFIGVR